MKTPHGPFPCIRDDHTISIDAISLRIFLALIQSPGVVIVNRGGLPSGADFLPPKCSMHNACSIHHGLTCPHRMHSPALGKGAPCCPRCTVAPSCSGFESDSGSSSSSSSGSVRTCSPYKETSARQPSPVSLLLTLALSCLG